jgi:TPR repeat protein
VRVTSMSPCIGAAPPHSNSGRFVCKRPYSYFLYHHCLCTQSLRRLQQAASSGNFDALYAIGRYHHLVSRDFVLAAHYYRAAADRGHPPSCTALGLLYRAGASGFPQDLSSAFSYFKMAADAGDSDGCVALGSMWEKGHGVVLVSMTTGVLQQDLAEAVRLYKTAADLGHADGQSNLGRMYAPRLFCCCYRPLSSQSRCTYRMTHTILFATRS